MPPQIDPGASESGLAACCALIKTKRFEIKISAGPARRVVKVARCMGEGGSGGERKVNSRIS